MVDPSGPATRPNQIPTLLKLVEILSLSKRLILNLLQAVRGKLLNFLGVPGSVCHIFYLP